MAIVTVTVADLTPFPTQWAIDPAGPQQRSPIPRGVITFTGAAEIAAKGAGDETSYILNLTMPLGFSYLPRRGHCGFRSDDLVESWENNGAGQYNRSISMKAPDALGSRGRTAFQMQSNGQAVIVAALAQRIWVPGVGAPKLLLGGGDVFSVFLSDMTAGATIAGDMEHQWEFYVFDSDQVDKWQVNTPIPIINHASF